MTDTKLGEKFSTSTTSPARQPTIHRTAEIEAGAVIGKGATIGPCCVVAAGAVINDDCRLISHVNVTGNTTIGPRTVVYPFASLGTPPQSLAYREGGPSKLIVGADCIIREGVTMNAGTPEGGGLTQVGDRGFYMTGSHVAHDCHVGDDVVFANCATLGGHCVVGDFVFIGGLAAAHQFTRIGRHAMIGGLSGVRGDVIPFGLVNGQVASLHGINVVVGMKRRSFATDEIKAVRAAYRALFLGERPLAQNLPDAEKNFGHVPTVAEIIAFIRDRNKRPLCTTGKAKQPD